MTMWGALGDDNVRRILFCHPERSEGSMSVWTIIVSWNCEVLFFNKSAAIYMDSSLRSLRSLVQNDKK